MGAPLWDRVVADLTTAMKARDDLRTRVLRVLKSDLKYKEIDLGRPLLDADCIAVLKSAVKKRNDSIDAFTKGGRADRAAEEEAELAVVKLYLPAELSDGELTALIEEAIAEVGAAGPKDFGKVMKAAVTRAAGRADGKRISGAVTARLNQ